MVHVHNYTYNNMTSAQNTTTNSRVVVIVLRSAHIMLMSTFVPSRWNTTTRPPLSPVAKNSPSWLNSTVDMMSAEWNKHEHKWHDSQSHEQFMSDTYTVYIITRHVHNKAKVSFNLDYSLIRTLSEIRTTSLIKILWLLSIDPKVPFVHETTSEMKAPFKPGH